jgi:hypothetical protein
MQARIGGNHPPETTGRFIAAKQGAILVDIDGAAFDTGKLNSDLDVQRYEFKFRLNNYLKAQPNPPVHSLAELIASGKYHKASLEKFLASAESYENGLNEPDYKDRLVKIDDLRVQLANLMAKNNVVALLYPHQKRLPVMIGEMNQPERNGILASLAGFPAITVPAGFSTPTESAPIGVPVGIEFLGPPFSEPQLLQITYGFEQATHARKPPQSTPPLNGRCIEEIGFQISHRPGSPCNKESQDAFGPVEMRLRVSDQVRNPNHYAKECQHERHQAHRKPRLAIHENGNCCESKRDRRKDRPKHLVGRNPRWNQVSCFAR